MLLLILFPFLSGIICYLFIYKKNIDAKIMPVLSVVLFFSLMLQTEYNLAIDTTSALANGPFSPGMTILIMVQRWLLLVVSVVAIVMPYFQTISVFRRITQLFTPILLVSIWVLFTPHLIAFFGHDVVYFAQFRFYPILLQYITLGFMAFLMLYRLIKDKTDVISKQEISKMLLVVLLIMPATMPQNLLFVFFGPFGAMSKNFTLIHRLSIYATFIGLIALYFGLKPKKQEVKKAAMVVLSIISVYQYLYVRRLGLPALPFHLCNTAIFLMLIAFVFNVRSVFYFSYFVNVLGAIVAIMMPNIVHDAFNMHSVIFWYNHIYAFILPILAVALGVFPRPKFKMIKGAIVIFTIYFGLMMVLNAWLNNYARVDFFFLYSDFLTEYFPFGVPIKLHYVVMFSGYGLLFKFFWLYNLLIYIGYIILMFIIWAVYDYMFKTADQLGALYYKLKMDQQDMLDLKSAMKGRPLSEPINLGGIKMIRIEHFSKTYGNAKKAAVDDLSLTIQSGEIFGFLGHNGAGKSTTIKSLVGIQSISKGKMEVAGYDISKQPIQAKLRIGYVSDNHAVYERLTGREYINYIADLYLVDQKTRDERIDKYVSMFSLDHAIDHEIKSYSHGMKQKIVVIASLIHDPKVWILDEPLTGLDPVSAFQIKECMKDHASRGNIVFFSSHIIEVVEKICDRIAIISKGKLQGVYAIKELHSQGMTLEKLYMQHVAMEQRTA